MIFSENRLPLFGIMRRNRGEHSIAIAAGQP